MKKTLLTLTSLIGVIAMAQTATANVSVKLNPIMSITVNQPLVAFAIDTEEEYLEGAETLIHDHLTTFSTVGYKVSTRYLTSDFADNTISVTASGVNNVDYGATVPLKSTSQQLFSSVNGLGRKSHDVKYIVKGGLYDQDMGTYETVVVYEITTN